LGRRGAVRIHRRLVWEEAEKVTFTASCLAWCGFSVLGVV
jgi:hypothetical protein